MHVLITRPLDSATLLSTRLKNLGHRVNIDPLIHIEPIVSESTSKPFLSPFGGIITTSQQGIRCVSNLTSQRDFPLWCVGSASAEIAKELGFSNIHAASGSAQDLIKVVKETLTPKFDKPILHASGDVIRVNVSHALNDAGISTQRVVVYTTRESHSLSMETQSALKAGILDAILFYSPRTACLFQTLCRDIKLEGTCSSITAVCFSEAIKTELKDFPWKKIQVAKKTTTDDLLIALMMAD